MQLTGVKSINEAKEMYQILYDKLIELNKKTKKVLLTVDLNGILLDNNNNIYSQASNNIIGYKHNKIYNLNNKDYTIDENTGCFILMKFEGKRTKHILDLNGKLIGYLKIELLKNNNKLYKNNTNIHFDYKQKLIFYENNKSSNVIGVIKYIFSEEFIKQPVCDFNLKIINYSINSIKFNPGYVPNLCVDINCININDTLDFELNRRRLFNELLNMNYTCEYKP